MAIIDNLGANAETIPTPLQLGLNSFLTYIKPINFGPRQAYVVCSEDGVELGVFPTRDAAFISARQHNLTPHSLQ